MSPGLSLLTFSSVAVRDCVLMQCQILNLRGSIYKMSPTMPYPSSTTCFSQWLRKWRDNISGHVLLSCFVLCSLFLSITHWLCEITQILQHTYDKWRRSVEKHTVPSHRKAGTCSLRTIFARTFFFLNNAGFIWVWYHGIIVTTL